MFVGIGSAKSTIFRIPFFPVLAHVSIRDADDSSNDAQSPRVPCDVARGFFFGLPYVSDADFIQAV
jgi:hypothetical protein